MPSLKPLPIIKAIMLRIVQDERASRVERIEAAKVAAACSGIILPDTNESLLGTKQAVELRHVKMELAERIRKRKLRRKLENAKAYLRRKARARAAKAAAIAAPGGVPAHV